MSLSQLTTVSMARFKRMKPRAEDRATVFIILRPGERLDQRDYSPLWHVADVGQIPAEDTPDLRHNGDVRYMVRSAQEYVDLQCKFTVVCHSGMHDSLALVKALYHYGGQEHPSAYPGRPYLEAIFYSILRSY